MEQITANELLIASNEIEKRVHELRLTEVETRDHITNLVKEIYTRGIWRTSGAKSLQAYCMKYLGYRAPEARHLAIQVGAILRVVDLRVENPLIQMRIDRLREWRRNRARKEGVAAYRVFSNRTLLELAFQTDLTPETLSKVKGMGENRMKAYGTELIALFGDGAPIVREPVSLPLV